MDLWILVACDFHELMNLPHTSRQATWKRLLGYTMRGVRYRKIWFRNPSCALGLSGKVGTAMITLLSRHSSIRDSGLFCSQHPSIVKLIWVIPATRRRRSLTLVSYRRQYWYYLLLFILIDTQQIRNKAKSYIALIGHVKEYPTMHHFGIPSCTQSMITYKSSTE